MRIKVRSPNDVLVGLFWITAAALALWFTHNLRIGTSAKMGPGYVPFCLAIMLAILGCLSCLRGLTVDGPRMQGWKARSLVVITAGISFFALSIDRFGLLVSIFGLVLISSFADPDARRGEAFLLSIGLAFFCVFVFAKALGLPIPVLPEGFR